MDGPTSKLRFKTFTGGDPAVEAFALAEDRSFQRIRFPVAHIVRYTEDKHGISSLHLTDGTHVRTSLPLEELYLKIAQPDGSDLIDLKPHTGLGLEKEEDRRLIEQFNLRAAKEDMVYIALYGFSKGAEKDVQAVIVNTKDITSFQEDKTYNRPNEIGFINIDSKKIHYFFFMPIGELQSRIEATKKEGRFFLNLLDETKPPEKEQRQVTSTPKLVA